MATVACEPKHLQKIRDDLIKAIAESKAIKPDALAKMAAEHQKLQNTEASSATLEAYLQNETAKADGCWSRAEALEEANLALKEEVELFKRERRQLQDELKRKDELIIYAVETRKAHKRSKVDLMAKLALKEDELKSSEARCAALQANLDQELTQARETWSRNLDALEKDNVALKEEVHLLKSAQSRLELVITQIEERQAHSNQTNQSDSMGEVSSNKELQSTKDELEDTQETPEASQELDQPEEEHGIEVELPLSEGGCSSEVELLQEEEECSTEVELPQEEEECSTEVKLPQEEEECSTQVELPQKEEECSTEVELPQEEEECSTEVELPQEEEECSTEVELPQEEEECSTQVELPQTNDECSTEVELPQSEGGCSSETQQLVILKDVKVEHKTEESKPQTLTAKKNKQLHQKKKKKKRRNHRPHSFY